VDGLGSTNAATAQAVFQLEAGVRCETLMEYFVLNYAGFAGCDANCSERANVRCREYAEHTIEELTEQGEDRLSYNHGKSQLDG
jgi:hypothetical protein